MYTKSKEDNATSTLMGDMEVEYQSSDEDYDNRDVNS